MAQAGAAVAAATGILVFLLYCSIHRVEEGHLAVYYRYRARPRPDSSPGVFPPPGLAPGPSGGGCLLPRVSLRVLPRGGRTVLFLFSCNRTGVGPGIRPQQSRNRLWYF